MDEAREDRLRKTSALLSFPDDLALSGYGARSRLLFAGSLSRSHADFPVAGHVRDVQFALSHVKGDLVISEGKRRHGDIAGVTALVGMDADHPIYGVNLNPQQHLQ